MRLLIDARKAAVGIENAEEVRGDAEEAVEFFRFLAQFTFRADPFGDVLSDAQVANDRSV
jgi:hypothetical protein